MAKSTAPSSNLLIRLSGKAVKPELVPFHVISSIVAAVQSIVAGHETEEAEGNIRLLKLRRGSVALDCFYPQADSSFQHIKDVQQSIEDQHYAAKNIGFAVRPLFALSAAAKRLKGTIEIIEPISKSSMIEIDASTYERFAESRFIYGSTTLVAEIIRVGGRTDRCVIQPVGEAKLLYCDVAKGQEGDELLKRLSRHLRERVVMRGRATWLRDSASLHAFTVTDISEKKPIATSEHIKRLRRIGGKRWSSIRNPKEHLARVLRGS